MAIILLVMTGITHASVSSTTGVTTQINVRTAQATMADVNNVKTLGSLSDLEWDYRVVLIQAVGVNQRMDEGFDVVSVLESSAAELDDRDIAWFVIADQQLLSNLSHTHSISKQFTASVIDLLIESSAKIILIGKDGGVKYRSNHIDLSVIFNRIDQMPMRRFEMQQ